MFIRSPPVPSFYRFGQAEIDALNRLEPTDSNVDTILERFCYFRGIQTYTRKNNRIRYCMKCKHIKPDRTHHCSSCKICVLKMDHHCPWINNCIHFDNYKIYFLLLIFTSIYCIYYAATCAEYVYVFFLFREGYIVWRELTYILSGISLLLAAMAVIALLGFHIALMLKNQTTLEAIAEPMFIDNCTYDLGTAENFFEVFGYNCCLWCLPIPSALGNGVHFPIRYY
ncbi:DHHC palmitoyltransferase [Popillia japonica]|uniref:Palmitoyltransferase n=1 Tax=Popillia japonica TaxID=7064 RepID=A0AAW1LUB4_POPJA